MNRTARILLLPVESIARIALCQVSSLLQSECPPAGGFTVGFVHGGEADTTGPATSTNLATCHCDAILNKMDDANVIRQV